MKNTSLTILQKINKQTPFSQILPIYNQERKHLKHYQETCITFQSNKFTNMITHISHIFDILLMTVCKCIKKGYRNLRLSMIFLILFIEEHYNKHKISS